LLYNDRSAKIAIDARGFNYVGKGNLDQAIFDIKTKADIDLLDFTFDGQPYLKNKKVQANLITKIIPIRWLLSLSKMTLRSISFL
jgi:AsmA protein